ncbi:peptidase inhibitor family I36 protein [Streptomyces sp. NPDC002701]|uniref:peptidase inhibitor family I36 protein n=1 Tax=Streptomyces sp. NPDC002701 TaxID=3364661 RepID=UPI0036BC538B
MRALRNALLAISAIGLVVATAPSSVADDRASGPDGFSQGVTVGSTIGAAAPQPSQQRVAAAPDGRVYVYVDLNFTGTWCGMPGNQQDYRNISDCPDMDNKTTSVWNNGYVATFDDVRLYRDYVYSGPNMCISVGDSWGNLDLGYEVFNTGEHANDKISSHIWANSCP